MNKEQIIWSVIVLVIVILLVLTTTSIKGANPSARDNAIEEDMNRPDITLNVKHQYKDGEHAFVGTLDLPSTCHSFNAEIVDGEMPEIKLTVNDPEEGVVCIQVVTKKTWKVVYQSDGEDLEFKGTLNGDPFALNLFDIAEDQDIDTVELFIKG